MMMTVTSVAFAADPALEGAGTESRPYVVADPAGLEELATNTAAYDGKYIVLGNDITYTSGRLRPIGSAAAPFKGIFDGLGYTIRNYQVRSMDNDGLFGYAVDAVIRNVTIENAKYTCSGKNNVGAVVGYAENTTVSNAIAEGCTITAGSAVGGIAGKVNNCEISDCRSFVGTNGSITVSAGNYAGGIVGEATDSSILRCINTMPVSMSNEHLYCGGIAGSVTGTVSHCINSGAVTNNIYSYSGESSGTAGIAGFAGGEISCCGNTGAVTSYTDCSAIAAVADQLAVSFCYNAGLLSFESIAEETSYAIAPPVATVTGCVEGDADALKSAGAYEGWDFDSVWFAPADYHDFAYPVLQDCNFHEIEITTMEPTCLLPGSREVKCTVPGCTFDVTNDTDPALGHDPIIKSSTEPNCSVPGEVTYKCSRCGVDLDELKEEIPENPEKHVDADNDDICDLCGKTLKEQEVKRNFFQKIGDFFRRIIEWIKNLFKKKG